jgi:hypothetical protein
VAAADYETARRAHALRVQAQRHMCVSMCLIFCIL